MSMHCLSPSARTEPKQPVVRWLLLLSALTALPCQSQETIGLASPNPLPAAVSSDVDVFHRYHLPRSNNHSIYFMPDSAALGESARQVIADTAARLNALPHLVVTLEGYSDELEEAAYGPELRKARIEAMIDALLELNVPRRRIVMKVGHDDQQASASCASEYCRQSYRRVRLDFSRAPGH